MKYQYKFGDKEIELNSDEDLVAVRFKEPSKKSARATISKRCGLDRFAERTEVAAEKYTILPVNQDSEPRYLRQEKAVKSLGGAEEVARVAPVFKLNNATILATDRIIIGFKENAENRAELIEKYNAEVIDEMEDDWVVRLEESQDPFAIANEISKESSVAYSEPDFLTIKSHLARRSEGGPQNSLADPESNKQYAINITKAVDAWKIQTGSPDVIIAILDEGVDTEHEDLKGAIVGSYDGTDDDEFQSPNAWDGHGTACAGLAAAIHSNDRGIKGIGGGCSIHAVRIAFSEFKRGPWVTSNSVIARSINWARKNNASVISNSWGGGAPSQAIESAFNKARTKGRNGKGCVIVVAAGNDSKPVDFPGNLANVLTVSASNEFDEFKTKRSRDGENWWGSSFGPEVDVAAPGVHNWTTDISGIDGYTDNNYTDFNGTSSATPIVAGAVGLVISANKDLSEAEVREIITKTADKVGGIIYNNGRNDKFGNGRLNVLKAVKIAKPDKIEYVAAHKAIQDVRIKDNQTSSISVAVGDIQDLKGIKVHVDIKHTYVGDLRVSLVPPSNLGDSILLQNQQGGGQDDLIKTYDKSSVPDLDRLIGENPQGSWTLEVADGFDRDEGNIVSFALELSF